MGHGCVCAGLGSVAHAGCVGPSLAALNEGEYWLAAPRAAAPRPAPGAAGASLWYRWRPTEKVCRARLPARRGGRVARLRRASKQFGSKGKIAARGTLRRSLYTAVGVPEHSSITKKRSFRLKAAVLRPASIALHVVDALLLRLRSVAVEHKGARNSRSFLLLQRLAWLALACAT